MNTRRFLAVACAAALAAGCGTGDETDYYTLVPVTGTVTLDGKPLAGAKVIFTPQGNLPDTPGSDMTGKDGNYMIMYRGRRGVAKGKYAVMVGKTLGEVAIDESGADVGEVSEEKVKSIMIDSFKASAAFLKNTGKKTRIVAVTQMFDREVGDKPEVFDFDLKQK